MYYIHNVNFVQPNLPNFFPYFHVGSEITFSRINKLVLIRGPVHGILNPL